MADLDFLHPVGSSHLTSTVLEVQNSVKLTTRFVDGWPMMGPLSRAQVTLTEQALEHSETVRGVLIGTWGQALVATNSRLLILKIGLFAGHFRQRAVSSFDYPSVRSLVIREGNIVSELELQIQGLGSAAVAGRAATTFGVATSAFGLTFATTDIDSFEAMAVKIREYSSL